jgi:hypothetical protein
LGKSIDPRGKRYIKRNKLGLSCAKLIISYARLGHRSYTTCFAEFPDVSLHFGLGVWVGVGVVGLIRTKTNLITNYLAMLFF